MTMQKSKEQNCHSVDFVWKTKYLVKILILN